MKEGRNEGKRRERNMKEGRDEMGRREGMRWRGGKGI